MSTRSPRRPLAAAATLTLALAAGALARAEPGYCLHVLGTFGGTHSFGHDVNDADPPQLIGEADLANGRHRGFLYADWDTGAALDIDAHGLGGATGVLEGCPEPLGCNTTAASLNDLGQVTGVGTVPRLHHAYVYPPLTDIGTLVEHERAQSFALGINADGAIVGRATANVDGEKVWHAFHWDGTTMVDLEDPTDPVQSEAMAIGDDGRVVGIRDFQATIWTHDGTTWAPTALTTAFASEAWDISRRGDVVGFARGRATAWRELQGTWRGAAVDDGPGVSIAFGTNDALVVAGAEEIDGQSYARLWEPVPGAPGTWTELDLSTAPGVPAEWVLAEARDVNETGWVAAAGFLDADGDGRQGVDEPFRAAALEPVGDVATCAPVGAP